MSLRACLLLTGQTRQERKAILFKAKEVPSTVGLLGLLGLLPWTGDWKHSLSLRKATLAFRSG